MIIPQKISLANIPTPLQTVKFNGSKFLIKRDDLTGLELSGNKVRKLEYLLFDAKRKKADYVFTCGGDQSNHCRATALAAASQGIKSRLFLWGSDKKLADGNLFLDKIAGAEFLFLNRKEYNNVFGHCETEKLKLEAENKKVYFIPEGGSSPLGIWGYISFVDELRKQSGSEKIKGILCAAGSGGTAAGILIGCSLLGWKIKLVAVNVLFPASLIKEKITELVNKCVDSFRMDIRPDFNLLEIADGFSEEGYKKILPEKVELIKDFAEASGIILDPAYTGKAFYAYNQLFLKNKKSPNVLFLHTGGLYGVFSKRKEYLLS